MKHQALWTRTFITLMAINFISALSFYLIMVKITEYAMGVYNVTYSIAASTVTVYVIGALVSRIALGNQIDHWGIKKSLGIGLALNTVMAVAYLVPMPLVALLVVRAIHGIGFALTSGAAGAGAALIVPASRRGEGIGYFSMMQALATGVGPFIAILLTSNGSGYTALFAFTAITCALAFAAVFLLKMPAPPSQDSHTPHARKVHGISSLIQVSVLPLAAVLFLVYVGYSGVLSFVVLYAEGLGLAEAVGMYFIVYAIVILLTRPAIGRRVDAKGENSSIYVSLASVVVGFVVLGLAKGGFSLLASAALLGFGIGATQSIVQTVIARDTPMPQLGRANSTFFMSMDFGSGVGPMVIGVFIPLVGYRPVYIALAVLAVAAAAIYHFAHGVKQNA